MAREQRLLLTENVSNLGIVGDVVDVRAGYARNYLLPYGLATEPSEEAIKALAKKREEVQKEMARLRRSQEEMIQKLDEFELTIERSANEQGVLFGGVSQHDIAEALRAEGFNVEDRHVRIGQQIKRLDSYPVPVVIAADLKVEIKLWVVSDKPVETEEEPAEEAAEEAPEAEAKPEKREKKEKAKKE